MAEEFEDQFEDESEDLNQDEFESSEFDDYDDDAGGKKWMPKNLLMWGVALMWSFFIVFVFMYYIVHKRNQSAFDIFSQETIVDMDSTLSVDSSAIALADSIHEAGLVDTARGYYVPPEGFLTVEDHMRILKLENGRRKREIDFLWGELRNLKKQTAEMDQIAQDVDSLKFAEPKTVVIKDSTSDKALKQKQLELEEQLELERQTRLAEEQLEKDKALASSAKIYSAMKPRQAAMILTDFDSETAAKMLMKIRERQAAKILEAMDPGKAIQISKYMVQ